MTSKQLLKNPKCQHHWPIPASFPWLRETQAPDFALLGSAPPNVEQFQGLIPRNYCSGVHKTGKSQS